MCHLFPAVYLEYFLLTFIILAGCLSHQNGEMQVRGTPGAGSRGNNGNKASKVVIKS